MPILVTWFESEKRNLVYTFIGTWSWPDCHEALDKAALMIEKVDYQVMQIVDLRQTHYAPQITLDGLSYIAKASAPNHERAKGVIIIGLKGSVLMAFNVFKQMFPKAAKTYTVANSESDLSSYLKRAGTAS
jgi:hypothetical protein